MNQLGKITEKYWVEISNHFQDIALGKFVVMPNHIHGIIQIVGDVYTRPENKVGVAYMQPGKLEAAYMRPLLSKVIQGYKAAVTREAKRKFNINFQWQRSFYDRIIRNETELGKIQEYIDRNPKYWDEDKNNVENIFY